MPRTDLGKDFLEKIQAELKLDDPCEQLFIILVRYLSLPVEQLRQFYQRVVNAIAEKAKIIRYVRSWEHCLFAFQGKIELKEGVQGGHLKFMSPEYGEAIDAMIKSDRQALTLFELLTQEMATTRKLLVSEHLAFSLTENYDVFPKQARTLLNRLAKSKDESVRVSVARAIRKHFSKTPSQTAESLLSTLAKDTNPLVLSQCAHAITSYYGVLSPKIKKALNKIIANPDPEIRSTAADALARRYVELPEATQVFFDGLLSDDDEDVRERAAASVVDNYNHLPPNIFSGFI